MTVKLLMLWLGPLVVGLGKEVPMQAPITQAQAARRFVQAALRNDCAAAQALLDPAVARQVSPAQLARVLARVQEPQQQFGSGVDLYKLGLRLSEKGQIRYFCAFTFKNDTLPGAPHVQLDVTFRDSVATQVLYFTLVPSRAGAPGLPLEP